MKWNCLILGILLLLSVAFALCDTTLSIGESLTISGYTITLDGIGRATVNNTHPAIFSLSYEGTSIGKAQINPGDSYTYTNPTNKDIVTVEVCKTALGSTLNASWAKVKMNVTFAPPPCPSPPYQAYGIITAGESLAGGAYSVQLGDIQLNTNAAIINILNPSGAVLGTATVSQYSSYIYTASNGDQITIQVCNTAPGFTLESKWAEVAVNVVPNPCPYYTTLHVGENLTENGYSVQLGDIAVITNAAILNILDSNNAVIGQVQVNPYSNYTYTTSTNDIIYIEVCQTHPGLTLAEKWAAVKMNVTLSGKKAQTPEEISHTGGGPVFRPTETKEILTVNSVPLSASRNLSYSAEENKTTFTLKIENNGKNSTGPIIVKEEIPDAVAANESELNFSRKPTRFERGSIIAVWEFPDGIEAGKSLIITYSVAKQVTSLADFSTEIERYVPVFPGAAVEKVAVKEEVTEAVPTEEKKAEEKAKTEQLIQLVLAFLAIIIASYVVLHYAKPPVQIEDTTLKLLENETRAALMNELKEADRIPTDLSARLEKSKAAIVEHLDILIREGLVEKVETPGRKFVFYRLTQKGRQVLLRMAA